MKTSGETEEPFAPLIAYLREQRDVVLAYLFGSYARGKQRPRSDVDLALLLDEQGRSALELLERRIDLAAGAAEIVGLPVDVVVLNGAPLLLQGEVLREGKLLYAADLMAKVEYEVRARTLYFDFQPRLRYQQEVLLQRAQERNRVTS